MKPRVLVAGVGNIFCGDDGFGSQVAQRLAAELPATEQVRVVDYGIRGLHLAYDLLDGYEALVIVDTLPGEKEPGTLTVLEVGTDDVVDGVFDAHGMDPVAVLASLGSLGAELPRTLVIGCQPLDVDAGLGLSPPVSRAVDAAVTATTALLDDLLGRAAAGSTGRQA